MNTSTDATDHGAAFIRSFIVKERRDRLLFERTRGGLLNRFCHHAESLLDQRYARKLTDPISSYHQIVDVLRKLGTVRKCYVLSMCGDIDEQTLDLTEALSRAVGFGMPSIISCLQGELVYLETEQNFGPPDRYILHRPGGLPSALPST